MPFYFGGVVFHLSVYNRLPGPPSPLLVDLWLKIKKVSKQKGDVGMLEN